VIAALLVLAAAGGTLGAVEARGELVWAGDIQGGEPYVYEDPDDPRKLIGFEVEIADELARRLGVRARFKQYQWSSLVPGLERGDFDVAMNGLEATSDRQDVVLMSVPYFTYAETLAIRKGAPYRSLDDLRGRPVATLNQSYAFDLLREHGIDYRLYEGVEEPYRDLVNGKVEAVLLDDIIATRYGCSMEGVECLPDEIARGVYVILMRKGDEALKGAIDEALLGMRRDGTLERILRKWKLWNERQLDPEPAVSRVDRPRTLSWQHVKLFLSAAWVTLELSILGFALAVPLGLGLALLRLYGRAPLRWLAAGYIEVFRGTPVLLQLYVIYFALGPVAKLSALQAAVLGLGLNYAAYEAEIYRGALLSLPRGQSEAAHSLGLSGWQTLQHVLIPQAFRVALPPMTNDFIALLKDSSIVGVIAMVELTKRMSIVAVDLHDWVVPGIMCAALYFAMSFPLARLARWLEDRLRTHHA
jgi:polar amino acid transport system substrate-binding protein